MVSVNIFKAAARSLYERNKRKEKRVSFINAN